MNNTSTTPTNSRTLTQLPIIGETLERFDKLQKLRSAERVNNKQIKSEQRQRLFNHGNPVDTSAQLYPECTQRVVKASEKQQPKPKKEFEPPLNYRQYKDTNRSGPMRMQVPIQLDLKRSPYFI